MATLTIKNIPDELYEQLKRSAEAQRRSINSEAIVCLERSLQAPRRDPNEMLESIRKFRQQLGDCWVTDAILLQAKRQGRP